MIGNNTGIAPPPMIPLPTVPQLQLAALERIEKLLEKLWQREVAKDAKAYSPPPQQGQAGGKQRRS